jgi:hypothetical protein
MAVMIAFFVAGMLIVLFVLSRVAGDGGGDDNEGGGGPGHRGDGGSPPRPKPRSPEPGWWPEFERDFRSYVQAQARRETVSGAG